MERSLFQKIALSSALLLLAACATGAIMTRSEFDNIELGTPVSEIVQKYGDPVKVKEYNDGSNHSSISKGFLSASKPSKKTITLSSLKMAKSFLNDIMMNFLKRLTRSTKKILTPSLTNDIFSS